MLEIVFHQEILERDVPWQYFLKQRFNAGMFH